MCEEIRMIAFDMDGVLTKCRSSWRALHLHFGSLGLVEEESSASKFRNGDIDYLQWMRQDTEAILLAARKPVRKEEIRAVLLGLEVDEDAERVVKFVKKLGIKTAIISGGIDILAEELQRKLGIDYVYANKLIFDENGFLRPGGVEVVNPLRKDEVLKELSSRTGIPLTKFMYIGDSEWDCSAFKAVKYPVFLKRDDDDVHCVPNLRTISRLRELIDLLEDLCGI
ncbi:MAG: HAD-IB family phosphatase [Desulfurococcales archaeon]|nr:HAD-IB family phosphatase [Desulfurococcales archaeon]